MTLFCTEVSADEDLWPLTAVADLGFINRVYTEEEDWAQN